QVLSWTAGGDTGGPLRPSCCPRASVTVIAVASSRPGMENEMVTGVGLQRRLPPPPSGPQEADCPIATAGAMRSPATATHTGTAISRNSDRALAASVVRIAFSALDLPSAIL